VINKILTTVKKSAVCCVPPWKNVRELERRHL
jgi:hypothetical protein